MHRVSPSVYARYTFEIDNEANNLHGVKLRMKFDDGYAAFLNGTPLASKNAPEDLSWNSTATAFHADSKATKWDEVEINIPGEMVRGKKRSRCFMPSITRRSARTSSSRPNLT